MIDIVFDGPPGPESGRFVEVKDESGKGIKFGEWVHRPDGYWALRIAAPQPPAEDTGLHPATAGLVEAFADAMARKLRSAEVKYGHEAGWQKDDWEAECRAHLYEHLAKGDSRDVANYCAFMWHHGWSTAWPAEAAGWQPIATAPADKTMVALLHVDGGFTRHGIGWYMPLEGWRGWNRNDGLEPTHWMRLPPVPGATPTPAEPMLSAEDVALANAARDLVKLWDASNADSISNDDYNDEMTRIETAMRAAFVERAGG